MKYTPALGDPTAWQHAPDPAIVGDVSRYCHIGQVGDHSWVRETFATNWAGTQPRTWYRADGEPTKRIRERDCIGVWQPSTRMPRSASRLVLEITGIRLDRLQAMSETDALNEGIEFLASNLRETRKPGAATLPLGSALTHYVSWWNAQYARRQDYIWAGNPWVWVVCFRVLHD